MLRTLQLYPSSQKMPDDHIDISVDRINLSLRYDASAEMLTSHYSPYAKAHWRGLTVIYLIKAAHI